jgi:hypothetical protein
MPEAHDRTRLVVAHVLEGEYHELRFVVSVDGQQRTVCGRSVDEGRIGNLEVAEALELRPCSICAVAVGRGRPVAAQAS